MKAMSNIIQTEHVINALTRLIDPRDSHRFEAHALARCVVELVKDREPAACENLLDELREISKLDHHQREPFTDPPAPQTQRSGGLPDE